MTDLLQLGALGALLALLCASIGWLVRRLNACEERCRRLEEKLEWRRTADDEPFT